MALASGGRLALGRRFASAERRSRESQLLLNRRCERVRTTEHAPRRPHQFLERIHGLAEIVKRGLVVFVELSPAPRHRFETSVVATAARAPTASATRSSSSSSPRARLSTATAHTGSEASCALLVRFARRGRRGSSPQNPLPVLPLFMGHKAALRWRARLDS